jgi:peroxiredoxin Q/BCP
LQKDLGKIEESGVRLVGISYDSVEVLHRFATKRGITFPLLSDPDSKVITAYALRNRETAGKKLGNINLDGIPYPGTYLIDKDGVIRGKLFVDGYRERHSTEELIKAVKALPKQ